MENELSYVCIFILYRQHISCKELRVSFIVLTYKMTFCWFSMIQYTRISLPFSNEKPFELRFIWIVNIWQLFLTLNFTLSNRLPFISTLCWVFECNYCSYFYQSHYDRFKFLSLFITEQSRKKKKKLDLFSVILTKLFIDFIYFSIHENHRNNYDNGNES